MTRPDPVVSLIPVNLTSSSLFLRFKQIDDVQRVQDVQAVKIPVEIIS